MPEIDARDRYPLPPNLPAPEDDGAADHLTGAALPSGALPSTGGGTVTLRALPGRSVVFAYPKTGRPGTELPEGWDDIPGARGCTPQACAFGDLLSEFERHGVRVFGLSTQDTAYQREAAERLGLPYPLLSDDGLMLVDNLGLPTFAAGEETLVKRLTMVVADGVVETVFYPVFPPDRNARDVLDWLAANPMEGR